MSTSVINGYSKDYGAQVHAAYQRQGTKLRNTVRTRNNVTGAIAVFQKVGKGAASTKARHGKVPVMNVDHQTVDYQFSCWNASDPNRAKIQRVDQTDRVFRICVRIARRAVAGVLEDPTQGATHYHARTILPSWAKALEPSAEIGNHLFYNDVEGKA